MLKNYLKVALRNLARHKLYTFINVFGLSLGVACCILILLFVKHEWSYDSFHKNADSLFLVLMKTKEPNGGFSVSAGQPMPLAAALRAEFPEIQRVAYFDRGGAIIAYGDRVFAESVVFSNADFFAMFDLEFVSGNPASALKNPNDIVLTETMAKKYFGDENPLGKLVHVRTRNRLEDFVVAGVVKPLPSNTSLRFNFMLDLTKAPKNENGKDSWVSAFVQLAPGTSVAELRRKIPGFVQEHSGELEKYYQDIKNWRDASALGKTTETFQFEFQPLRDIHLDARVRISQLEQSDPSYSYILAGIAVLVLLIACINFMTLAVARSANRAKEVGMRKVLGAVQFELMRQFWGEAFLLCWLALLFGIVLAELGLPAFNQLADKNLSLGYLFDGWLLAGIAGLLLLVGLIAGSYPALFLSRFEPVEILKGKTKADGKSRLTQALVMLQFSLAIFLIAATLGMSKQLKFLVTKNLGFNPAQVVALQTHVGSDYAHAKDLVARFRARAMSNANVISVSGTNQAFALGYDRRAFQYQGEGKNTFIVRADEEYLGTLGIGLKEGRNFIKGREDDRKRGMIVNEAFLRHLGWGEPAVGKWLTGVSDTTLEGLQVIGVVKDFHFRWLREDIRPLVIFENDNWRLDCILVRIAPVNIPATMKYLQEVWKEAAPDKPFKYWFLDEAFQSQYWEEMNWRKIVEYSSLFAVSLACLGLFGLATLSAASRTKEIGIRNSWCYHSEPRASAVQRIFNTRCRR